MYIIETLSNNNVDISYFISLSGDIPCCPLKRFKAHKNQVCIFSELPSCCLLNESSKYSQSCNNWLFPLL